MAKRKAKSTKTKESKVSKIEKDSDNHANDEPTNEITESKEEKLESYKKNILISEKNNDDLIKDDSIDQKIESNEEKLEKLEKFKKKFGMIKSEFDDKNWVKGNGYLVYNPLNTQPSSKIAAFDLDDTLITTKSGKKFAVNWEDWKFMLDVIPGKLKSLHNEGYKIVLFSNQGGLDRKKLSEKDFKRKIIAIIEKSCLNIQVFISTLYGNVCRKPNKGLFDLLASQFNSDEQINLNDSFYVGDAAGRPNDWAPNRKKDFSYSDRLFALNCQIGFYTPEEYFLGEKEEVIYNMPAFRPAEHVKKCTELTIKYDEFEKTTNNIEDILPANDDAIVMVLMVGTPGSGKSTFVKRYLEPLGFDVVNRDKLNTWQKCVAETKRLLNENKNVVIDNTNPDIASRDRYLSLAAEMGVKHVICVMMDISEEQCRHNELFRQITIESHEKVSEIVFNKYKASYQEPDISKEKFTIISKVVPALIFDNEDHKEMYSRYLLDR